MRLLTIQPSISFYAVDIPRCYAPNALKRSVAHKYLTIFVLKSLREVLGALRAVGGCTKPRLGVDARLWQLH